MTIASWVIWYMISINSLGWFFTGKYIHSLNRKPTGTHAERKDDADSY